MRVFLNLLWTVTSEGDDGMVTVETRDAVGKVVRMRVLANELVDPDDVPEVTAILIG